MINNNIVTKDANWSASGVVSSPKAGPLQSAEGTAWPQGQGPVPASSQVLRGASGEVRRDLALSIPFQRGFGACRESVPHGGPKPRGFLDIVIFILFIFIFHHHYSILVLHLMFLGLSEPKFMIIMTSRRYINFSNIFEVLEEKK